MAQLQQQELTVRSDRGGIKDIIEPLIGILTEAINEGATDIHFDPFEGGKHVRYRVDGVIHDKPPVPTAQRKRLLNQVKVLMDLDIDKSFVPEEGFISLEYGDVQYDVRVTIAPVGDREAIHFRFLSSGRDLLLLENIGMRAQDLQTVQEVIDAPSGLVLVAGGIGSGKTTTLYALANTLKRNNLIVASIEDPVEFRLPHVRQLEVSEKHGFSMYEGLRVLLRMDPDVIAIGEIRDEPSATTAVRAGLSGQLVMATIHARSASMAVDALNNMRVPRYVIGGALRLVVRQNLVLRLCPQCAQEHAVTDDARILYESHQMSIPDHFFAAGGCEACKGYGHKGRIGVFELTPVSQELGQDIAAGLGTRELAACFSQCRSQTLAQDVLHKAAEGHVSWDVAQRFIKGLSA